MCPGLGTGWTPLGSSVWFSPRDARALQCLSLVFPSRDAWACRYPPGITNDAHIAVLGVTRWSPVPLPLSVGSRPQNCFSGWLQGPKQSRYEGMGSPFSAWFAVGNPSPLSCSLPPMLRDGFCSLVNQDTFQREGRTALDYPGQEGKSLLSWGNISSPCSKAGRATPQPKLPARPSGAGI